MLGERFFWTGTGPLTSLGPHHNPGRLEYSEIMLSVEIAKGGQRERYERERGGRKRNERMTQERDNRNSKLAMLLKR